MPRDGWDNITIPKELAFRIKNHHDNVERKYHKDIPLHICIDIVPLSVIEKRMSKRSEKVLLK